MEKEKLLHRFRTFLTENHYGPGDKLPGELELAKQFHVSRGDIREVLMHFSQLGVILRVKKRGTFIREVPYDNLEDDIALCFQLSKFRFEDLKEARLHLELAIVPLVRARIVPAMLELMRKNVLQMEQLQDKPEKADALDRDFHLLFFEAAGNPALKLFSAVLQTLFKREYRAQFQTEPWVRRSVEDHKAILHALETGNEGEMRRLIELHLNPKMNENPTITGEIK